MDSLEWASAGNHGYAFAEVAQTNESQYIVDRNPDSDGWVGIVLDEKHNDHRRQFFDSKDAAKDYCEKMRIERGE